jgi:hypothetical protein
LRLRFAATSTRTGHGSFKNTIGETMNSPSTAAPVLMFKFWPNTPFLPVVQLLSA